MASHYTPSDRPPKALLVLALVLVVGSMMFQELVLLHRSVEQHHRVLVGSLRVMALHYQGTEPVQALQDWEGNRMAGTQADHLDRTEPVEQTAHEHL